MKLSVIIIEYHCMDQVENCVRSVLEHLGALAPECLVLSNSQYAREDLTRYEERLGDVTLISSGENLGYAGGVNAALKEAGGDFAFILNPDCLLTDANVYQIIEDMSRDPEWAIAGPKVVDEDGVVQPSCRRFPKPWSFILVRSVFSNLPGAARERNRYLMGDYDRNSPKNVDWVSGGATIVKTSALGKIGGMDERYFLYMEDVDWCRAAWSSGSRVVYHPGSTVIHAGRHQSIRGGMHIFTSPHLRWHVTSLFKYFRKYGWRTKPDSEGYRKFMEIDLEAGRSTTHN